MDLDPKGANNQIKEAIDKRYLPEDEGEAWTWITLKQYRKSNGVEAALKLGFSFSICLFLWSAAEVDDSQDSSIMTDADDTQLHTAESDDVL